jgi:hypothetical protein
MRIVAQRHVGDQRQNWTGKSVIDEILREISRPSSFPTATAWGGELCTGFSTDPVEKNLSD